MCAVIGALIRAVVPPQSFIKRTAIQSSSSNVRGELQEGGQRMRWWEGRDGGKSRKSSKVNSEGVGKKGIESARLKEG